MRLGELNRTIPGRRIRNCRIKEFAPSVGITETCKKYWPKWSFYRTGTSGGDFILFIYRRKGGGTCFHFHKSGTGKGAGLMDTNYMSTTAALRVTPQVTASQGNAELYFRSELSNLGVPGLVRCVSISWIEL